MKTFNTFSDLARHLHEQDVKRAKNLQRSATLRKSVRKGSGPAVAK